MGIEREGGAVLRPEVVESCGVRRVSVRQVLEWAFGVEGARLDFDPGMGLRGYGYASATAAILRHEQLGCRIDGGGVTPRPDDADMVAEALARLPRDLGGRRVAGIVAELARAGRTPNPMLGAVPRVVPVEVHVNRHGMTARRERIGQVTELVRGRNVTRPVEWCRVTFTPTRAEIDAARARWLEWRGALHWLSRELRRKQPLSRFEVTPDLPPARPWRGGRGKIC